MKSIKLMSLLVMTLAFIATSCKEKDDEEKPTLGVSTSSITAPAEQSTQNLNITSNTNWSISDIPSWIDVEPSSGKGNSSVQITVRENTKTEERTSYLIVSTNDGSLEKNVRVTQSGKYVTLMVDVTNINLSSNANASHAINITCNSSWSVSGVPEWLQVSALSGNGNSSIVVTARNANESASVRNTTLTISSEGQSQSVTIQQEPALSSCRAIPSNITSLWYAVVFNLTYSSEVALTKMLLISDYDFKHKTESEIINEIEKEDSQIPEDNTIYTRPVNDGTKYHILSISYDKKGNRGELVNVEFDSPNYLSATDDAWCAIEDAQYNSSSFWFSVEKRGRCATYDLIYGANIYPGYLRGPLMAFELNYYINNGKKNWLAQNWDLQIETNYPNNNTFSCAYNALYNYGGVIATTWGVFNDGTRSSDITTVYKDTYEESVRSMKGEKNSSSEIEWIKNQKGWIKTTPKDLKR